MTRVEMRLVISAASQGGEHPTISIPVSGFSITHHFLRPARQQTFPEYNDIQFMRTIGLLILLACANNSVQDR